MKILIADDEEVSLRMLEKTLERHGYEVIAVRDGREAAERLCDPDGPRLALLDWVMPRAGRSERLPNRSQKAQSASCLSGSAHFEICKGRHYRGP